MEKKSSVFIILAYLYLVIPNLIFFINWCNIPTALICSAVLISGLFFTIKNAPKIWSPNTKKEKILVLSVLLISALWVCLSGIGGFMFQNNDHGVRNALFDIMLIKKWPVCINENEAFLSYYIGFFLPPAVIGKYFKDLYIGFACQYIWALTGVFTFFYLILAHLKQKNLFPVLFFIFFSGLDIIGMYYLHNEPFVYTTTAHLEWWGFHQYSSMTTQLFWVFNQAIPAWIIISIFLNEKNNKSLVFLYVCLFLNSTLPAVGLLPFLIYFIIKNGADDIKEVFTQKHLKSAFFDALSIQNISSVLILFPVLYFYLTSNYLKEYVHFGDYKISSYQQTKINPLTVLVFWILEAGVFLLCTIRYNFKNILYWMVFIILLCLPFCKIGNASDFEMRASIPSLVFLFLIVVRTIQDKKIFENKILKIMLFIFILIGAITPFNEISRSVLRTKYNDSNIMKLADVQNTYKHLSFYGSMQESIFYKYFAKKNN